MPAMMGKAKAQQKLIENLEGEFAKVYMNPPATLNCSQIYDIDKEWKLKKCITGTKGVPSTSRRLSKCWTLQRCVEWL